MQVWESNVPCISIFGCVSYDDNSGTEEQPPSAKKVFPPRKRKNNFLGGRIGRLPSAATTNMV